MVRLTFATTLPVLVFIVLILLAMILVVWTMPRGRVENPLRILLLACRMLAMAVGVLILAQPSWTRTIQSTHPDVVPILMDVSASMAIVENGRSRFDNMVDAASHLSEAAKRLSSDEYRRIEWFTFSDSLGHTSIGEDGTVLLPSPAGGPTRIGVAVSKMLDGLDGDRVAGVVLCSDGRGDFEDAEASLRRIGAAVWVIPMGDLDPPPDITIKRVEVPRTAFSEDQIPVRVVLQRVELDSGEAVAVMIRVIDELSGAELSTVEASIEADGVDSVTLMIKPDIPGLARWRVEVGLGDRLLDSRVVEVDVRDRPLRLLYIEGKPRFLYRFLVPLFTRDQSIDVSILLQSADRDAAPVGDQPIRRLPDNIAELEQFDIIIIGDVDPSGFTEGQLDVLRTHLLSGAGVLWIPGSNIDPEAWRDTPLATLLPVPPDTSRHIIQGQLVPVAEGEALGLSPPTADPLAWAIAVDDHRPQARVLLQMRGDDGLVWPAFLLLPTGKGRSGWLATDDVWRWRRAGGDDPGGSFVLGMIRLLARHVAPQAPMLRVIPQPVVGQPTTILLEGGGVEEGSPTLEVNILDSNGVLRQRVQLHSELPDTAVRRGGLSQGWSWRGLWQPESAGVRHLTLTLGDPPMQQEVFVLPTDAEDMRPGVNMHALELLAGRTGGRVVDEVSEVLHRIPRRSTMSTRVIDDGPMAPWLLWTTLAALLVLEWGVRRWNALA